MFTSDIPPNQTIYIKNLNEKVKKEGGEGEGGGSSNPPRSKGGGSSNAPGSSLTSGSQPKEAESEASEHVPASNESRRFPSRRPDMGGELGVKCMVRANHFLIELESEQLLHRYTVTVTPKHTFYSQRRTIIKKLVHRYRADLGKCNLAYDGHHIMYSTHALPFKSKKFCVSLTDGEEGPGGSRRGEGEFKVLIELHSCSDLTHLFSFLEGREADSPRDTIQALNIILREKPNERFLQVGRSFCFPDLGEHDSGDQAAGKLSKRRQLGGGIESWRGFFQSVRPTQMGLSLNIDMLSIPVLKAVRVIEFVNDLLGRDIRDIRDISNIRFSDADHAKIRNALNGVKVEVTHAKEKMKYRISGLTSLPSSKITFPIGKTGKRIALVKYFKETYRFDIQYTHLPCVQVGRIERQTYIPMELCYIVKGQRYSKSLNASQVSALRLDTCKRPKMRQGDIIATVEVNQYAKENFLKKFGFQISQDMAEVVARVLPAPKLKYSDSSVDILPVVGKWDMTKKKVYKGGIVDRWICINFSTMRNYSCLQFCKDLANRCNECGMKFTKKPALSVQSSTPDMLESVLNDVLDQLEFKFRDRKLDMLIAILPDKNGSLYGDLKRICETDHDIVSQCCVESKVTKKLGSYLESLALKINIKTGGTNVVLADALTGCIAGVSGEPTIIFGADVTHYAGGQSIAAVVASQDWPEITKYAGLVSAQKPGKEIIENLYKTWDDPDTKEKVEGGMIMELLSSFSRDKDLPKKIIFYRDGVGETQFEQVLLEEVEAIRKACKALDSNYNPGITFLVVQKRHHTRLFAGNHDDEHSVDPTGNILPGTVVDSTICHPTEFDFYLCSHAGVKGTSRPTHYHVLCDENNFSSDDLQCFTNSLCYTFAPCLCSISIVPPAYYAHQAAFRARFYLNPEIPVETPGAANDAAGPVLLQPKENVKKVMFFC